MRACWGLVLLLLAGVARPDRVVLQNGRVLEGAATVERVGEQVRVGWVGGGQVVVRAVDVLEVIAGVADVGSDLVAGPALPARDAAAPRQWRLLQADVGEALAARGRARRAGHDALRPRVVAAARGTLDEACEALRACWDADQQELADWLVAARRDLAHAQELGPSRIEVGWDDGLVVRARWRPGDAPFAVVVAPGSWARPVGVRDARGQVHAARPPRSPSVCGETAEAAEGGRALRRPSAGSCEPPPGWWQRTQPQAPVTAGLLRLDGADARLRLESLCCDHAAGPPCERIVYRLERFPAGSPEDRLLRVLATEQAPHAAQDALWVLRNDLRGSASPGAVVELLLRAGLDPRSARVAGGAGLDRTRLVPAAPAPARPDVVS